MQELRMPKDALGVRVCTALSSSVKQLEPKCTASGTHSVQSQWLHFPPSGGKKEHKSSLRVAYLIHILFPSYDIRNLSFMCHYWMKFEVPRPPVIVEVPEVLNSSVKTLVAYGALHLGIQKTFKSI